MKKLYFFLVLCGLSISSFASQLTFRFDASTLNGISPAGIHVAGGFQDEAGFPGDWDPATALLNDDNCDFIYELSVTVPDGTYEFKFVNGNAWGSDETGIPATCNSNGNRTVTVNGDTVYGPVCWNDCGPCLSTMPTTVPVTLRVDMSLETVTGVVSVAGSFQAAAGVGGDWTPGAAVMTDPDGDKVYEIAMNLAPGCYQYKFLNGDEWGEDEGAIPAECNVGGNRQFIANYNGLDAAAVCYKQCAACPTTVDTATVTFQVDMSRVANLATLATQYGIDGYSLSSIISVAGSFQGAAGVGNNWTPGAAVLTDPDGDKIYTLTVELPEGTYQYKFLNGDAWGKEESVPSACNNGGNRELVVNGSAPVVLPAVCFGYCEDECPPALPPVNITFRVDMNDEIVNADGVYVAGGFQRPTQWVKDTLEMTETEAGSGVYEYTYLLFPGVYTYKFFNGDGGDAEGETHDFETGGCGVGNGLGGYNRLMDISDVTSDYKLPVYRYNSCNELAGGEYVGITPINQLGFSVSPNPFTNQTIIRFDNTTNTQHSLSIVNVFGQEVRRYNQLNGTSVVINRGTLASGMYYAILTNSKGERGIQKLVIE
ncbi:MAG TPA: T9SS type A sorting domain-containing protein [Chitinophagales bacterium]|nr:T9SS type A sorting domain-containing protein [Chitinophagales bacterium]